MMKPESDKVLEKMQHYCSYRERCRAEVNDKLKQFCLSPADHENILTVLAEHSFYNDRRFAESFVHSKCSYNKWGKIKIRLALRQKKINETIIADSLATIDEDQYTNNLRELFTKKKTSLKDHPPENSNHLIYNYLLGKGYESELILWELNRSRQ